jgi:hypothetical protein
VELGKVLSLWAFLEIANQFSFLQAERLHFKGNNIPILELEDNGGLLLEPTDRIIKIFVKIPYFSNFPFHYWMLRYLLQ